MNVCATCGHLGHQHLPSGGGCFLCSCTAYTHGTVAYSTATNALPPGPFCAGEGPSGYLCTLAAGHAGEHVANGESGDIYERWTDPATVHAAWAEQVESLLANRAEEVERLLAKLDAARTEVARLREGLTALDRDLDAGRADGTIYTYGQVQARLRALLAEEKR